MHLRADNMVRQALDESLVERAFPFGEQPALRFERPGFCQ